MLGFQTIAPIQEGKKLVELRRLLQLFEALLFQSLADFCNKVEGLGAKAMELMAYDVFDTGLV